LERLDLKIVLSPLGDEGFPTEFEFGTIDIQSAQDNRVRIDSENGTGDSPHYIA
jgi:hypothetical protein